MEPDAVILAPVLTEKTNTMREGNRKTYVFRVNPRANKIQIMKAINAMFAVNAMQCRVITVKPKPRKARTKSGFRMGRTATWKKALVTLRAGERIEVFEGS